MESEKFKMWTAADSYGTWTYLEIK